MTEWIPVSERLPKKDAEYLCLVRSKFAGYNRRLAWFYTKYKTFNRLHVEYWLDIPPEPKA